MKIRHSFFLVLIVGIAFYFIQSQTVYTLTGTVLDSSGDVVIGAIVQEELSKKKVVSDFDGKFILELQKEHAKLTISYTGLRTKKIETTDFSKPLKIVLDEGVLLEEVVVKEYKVPLINFDQTSSQKIMASGQISSGQLPATKSDNVSDLAVRGSRAEPAKTYVDGIQVTGESHHRPKKREKKYHLTEHEEVPPENGNYTTIKENEFFSSTQDPLSTLSIDVDRASYSNVRRFLQQGVMPHPDAIRVEEMINYFNYDYKAPKMNADRPFNTEIQLTDCPWNSDHQLMHVSLQGAKLDRTEIPASNFVFLLDVSGSMNSPNKLPLLKSAFKLLVNQMNEEDRIAIVVYAGAAGCVLESTPGSEKAKIIASLDNLRAGGSTAGAAGIQQAYKIAQENFIKGGNNRIILATDGDFNVGTSGDDALVKLIEEKRKNDVFLSILGFGQGNYQDGKMQKIADAGNGNHSYIDNMTEAKKVLMDEFGGTMFTIAKDVKIQIEFNPMTVEGYRMVGYENRVLAAQDFNDDTKDAGEMGAGHTVTVLYEIIPKGSSSSFSKKIDPLKYQIEKPRRADGKEFELATIKYRFKKPTEKRSTKSEEVISTTATKWSKVSENVKWAAHVAEFGLLMRNSKYVIDSDYERLISSIKTSLGEKSDQYRSEMLDLVEIAKAMDTNHLTVNKE